MFLLRDFVPSCLSRQRVPWARAGRSAERYSLECQVTTALLCREGTKARTLYVFAS
jgi:hypothetical protein